MDGIQKIQGPVCLLAVEDGGSGTKLPVVLAHSLGGDLSHWNELSTALRAERRTVRFDLRGHGESGMPSDHDFSIEGFASDMGAVADALGIGRFIAIGHSAGGGAAYAYAATHPERVAGFIALEPVMDRKAHPQEIRIFADELATPVYGEMLASFWQQLIGSDARTRARVLPAVLKLPQETVARGFRQLLDFDAVRYAGAFRGPALSIVTPSDNGPYSLHNLPPGFSHITVHGTGHWLHLEKPAEIRAMVQEFLRHADK